MRGAQTPTNLVLAPCLRDPSTLCYSFGILDVLLALKCVLLEAPPDTRVQVMAIHWQYPDDLVVLLYLFLEPDYN